MSVYFSWPVLSCFAAGIGTLYLLRYLVGYRDKPGALWFAAALVGQAVFVFTYGVGLTVTDQGIRWAFEVVSLVSLHWLGVPFLGFALEYTGRGDMRRSWYFWILFVFPLSATILLPLNPWHGLFWTEFTVETVFGVSVAAYDFGLLMYVTVIGGLGWSMAGVLLLVDTVWDYGSLFRSEALAVALSFVPPVFGFLLWLFELTPDTPINWVGPLLVGHVLFDLYAFVGRDMFEIYPATNRAAKQSALDDFRAPVLVLEAEGRVVELNPAAESELGLDREETLLKPVSSVLNRFGTRDIDGTETVKRYLDSDDEWRLSIRDGTNRAEYVVQPSPLTAGGGERVGYTLLFQDITEEIRREERLSVLNRILRHNLRNDLSVVSGYVSAVDSRTEDEQIEGMLDKVATTVNNIIETGEMARDFEKLIAEPEGYTRSVELDGLLDELVERLAGEYPAADISFDTRNATVETNPDILRPVLWQLLDNAVVHSDSDPPDVSLSIHETDTTIDIEIADDGPGIPDHELQSLRDGQETSLDHGSGFGLWLVKWGTTRVGGTVEFDTEGAGTTVRVSLPRETEPPVTQTSSASA